MLDKLLDFLREIWSDLVPVAVVQPAFASPQAAKPALQTGAQVYASD